MKENRYFAVVFMFVLTALLSGILIGLARFTEPAAAANRQIAFETAVIRSFPQIQAQNAAEIHTIFSRDFTYNNASAAYEYRPGGTLAGFALPFEGQGFWSIIKGVIGIGADKTTITGIWFYEQAETPGLGSRIAEPFFYGQFAGKSFAQDARPVRIRPLAEATEKDIQAISGATQTCTRLETLLNAAVEQWRQKMKNGGAL
jgi:Na+-transporting NADH:ubiquinone oxidoreductase subunit C